MLTRFTHAARVAFSAGLLVGALALVPTAFAGGGGHKPGGGGTTTPTATLYASCNPCAVGSIAEFWGSGYTTLQNAQVWITSGFQTTVPVASDGTVHFGWYMSAPGTYDVRLYQQGNGGKLVLKGEVVTYAQ